MKFIAVLSQEYSDEITSGNALNALAQMTLGLGHRLSAAPDVDIYFGEKDQVRAFRILVLRLAQENPDSVVYSDFPHTMKGGDTGAIIDRVASTAESEIIYFGACIVCEELDPRLNAILQNCLQLKNYQPYKSESRAHLLPHIPKDPNSDLVTNMKTSTVINKFPLAKTINAIVLANLDVGKKTPFVMLRLIQEHRLTGISWHTHPILKSESSAKHKGMAEEADSSEGLYSSTLYESDGQPLVTVTFGPKEKMEAIFTKKKTRVYNSEIAAEGFDPIHARLPTASLQEFSLFDKSAVGEHASGDLSEEDSPGVKAFNG